MTDDKDSIEKRRIAFKDFMSAQESYFNSEEYQEARRIAEENVVKRRELFDLLEEEIPGLSIVEFGGAMPVQGFGMLGDEYWYFRFRYNNGTLSVGPYDEEIEDAIYKDAVELHYKRLFKDPDDIFNKLSPKKEKPENGKYYPHKITRISRKSGPIEGDTYNGTLDDPQEAYEFLREMFLNLEEVPEDEQINRWLRAKLGLD